MSGPIGPVSGGAIQYDYPGPGSLDVDVQGNLFSRAFDRIWIADEVYNTPANQFVDYWSFPIPFPPSSLEIAVAFTDLSKTRITDASTFFVNTSLVGWDLAELKFIDENALEVGSGTITSLVTLVPELGLSSVNVDFGTVIGAPATSYGAAAGQTGKWNQVGLGPTALVDPSGGGSGVMIDVSASFEDDEAPAPSDDDAFLLKDYFHSGSSLGWDVVLSGLLPGDYVAYLYAPSKDQVPTGDMIVGGVAVASLPGDGWSKGYPGSNLIEGTSWASAQVTVSGDTLAISCTLETFGCHSGLAGLQLVPAPEPGWIALMASGLSGLCLLAQTRRKRRC
jgi:hypothetical protein